MTDLYIYTNSGSLEKVKDKVFKAKATDELYVYARSVGEEFEDLRGILDTLLQHLNNKYEKEYFVYALSLLFSTQFISHRLWIEEKLGKEEVGLYENFLKNLPERVYCSLMYEFSSSLSVESYSLGFILRR